MPRFSISRQKQKDELVMLQICLLKQPFSGRKRLFKRVSRALRPMAGNKIHLASLRFCLLTMLSLALLTGCANIATIDNDSLTDTAFSHSWYLTADPGDSSLQEIKALGIKDATLTNRFNCKTYPGIVVFAAGQPTVQNNVLGINDYKSHFWSIESLTTAIQQYVISWLDTANYCSQLIVTPGIANNACAAQQDSCTFDYNTFGQAWARMINDLGTWVQDQSKRVSIWGAAEIRTEWDAPAPTRQFVDSYLATIQNNVPLLNYGTMKTDSRWTSEDIQAVTIHEHITVVPQILSLDDLKKWIDYKKQHSAVSYMGMLLTCTEDDEQLLNIVEEDKSCQIDPQHGINIVQAVTAIKKVLNEGELFYSVSNIQRYEQHPFKPTPTPPPSPESSPTPCPTLPPEFQPASGPPPTDCISSNPIE